MATMSVQIISFGYGHPEGAPEAHLTIDLRKHFRDPHVSPEMRYMTARDELVRTTVMNTSGIRELVLALVTAVDAFSAGPSAVETTVAVGCAGGRHRAATVAMALAAVLSADTTAADAVGLADVAAARRLAHDVEVTHRDLDKDVISR
ncbi:RNase adapter RapZ [Streptomyces sp. NPDC053720]|uniref:RapZ C-terminal domain-containing protein n=1 Tax=Streptomyces sp. NPDC053720 TaxID=3154855 RepID=UPI0034233D09